MAYDDWKLATPPEYSDDWWCRYCNHGPLTETDDSCPECGTLWNENEPKTPIHPHPSKKL